MDPTANDSALIRALYYDEQQFVQGLAGTPGLDWTADEYGQYVKFTLDHNGPELQQAMGGANGIAVCVAADVKGFRETATLQERTMFETDVPDMSTIQSVESFHFDYQGQTVSPSGHVYILRLKQETLDGTVHEQDVHATVIDGKAFWFVQFC